MSSKSGLLKTASFGAFSSWDVKQFFLIKVLSAYSVEKLGKHIIHQTEKVQLSDFPDTSFGILGVSNRIGMFDADTALGKSINQKYHIVKDNWLAYNPYRVNVGSIGLKTSAQKGSYISPAYVVFSCKDTLIPEYIWLLMKSSMFNSLIRSSTTGTVRQTLGYDNLADISAPIPPIKEQQKILDEYHRLREQAEVLEHEATVLESGIDNYLYDVFNLTEKDTRIVGTSLLNTTRLSDNERWDVDYALNQSELSFLDDCNCELKPASTFILSTQYGLSEKANRDSTGVPMIRMGNIQNCELDLQDMKYLPNTTKLDGRYLDKGDLLFNRTNSKELVGKTAIFKLDADYVFASYLIRIKLDPSQVDVEYINYLFASKIIRKQIDLVSRQVLGQVNINAGELSNLRFPIPPIASSDNRDITQEKIVSDIRRIKEEAKNKRISASILRQDAHTKFENNIFSN